MCTAPQSLRGDPLHTPLLEALRIFTTLEASIDELETKRTHTLPVADRVASFVCLRGLQAEAAELNDDKALWFRFDPAAPDKASTQTCSGLEGAMVCKRYGQRPNNPLTSGENGVHFVMSGTI